MISNHFPPNVRDALVAASNAPEERRLRAIKRAVYDAHRAYPEYFRKSALREADNTNPLTKE